MCHKTRTSFLYNPYLLLRYECHICLHVVTSATFVQYIYKYVTKNASFTRAKIGTAISEIEEYRNARYVAASEACWRLLGFNMMSRAPAVTYCNVHLQDEQNIQIHYNDTHAERVEAARKITSDLLKYFGRPQSSDFDRLTILQFCEKYTNIGGRGGTELKDRNGNTVKHQDVSSTNHVARIAIKTLHQGDVFYLRLLLYIKAARTFCLANPYTTWLSLKHKKEDYLINI